MTCYVRTGKSKIQMESNNTTFSLYILVSTITMSYCVLKLHTFQMERLAILSNYNILKYKGLCDYH